MSPGIATPPVTNVMTVDVEDYFQVSAFEAGVSRDRWGEYESRVVANTERVLKMFAESGVQATFFVLGWVADHQPRLVTQIAAAGHEIASHGYWHRLVYEMTPAEFREDLRRARTALESVTGQRVVGFRAPSYSITSRSLWALDVLIEEGYAYDASIFPVRHDRYGIPSAPRHPHRVERNAGALLELPGSTVRVAGANVPVAGGGYFRIFPYRWTRWGIRHVNGIEGMPVVFYVHPWEADPEQPRLAAPRFSRFRHYHNLHQTEYRLRRLLAEFRFGTAKSLVLGERVVAREAAG